MGRGESKLKRRKKNHIVKYDDFMKMSEDQKISTIQDIINDQSIKVPDYLDNSATSKVMYALGMDNKPKVVSDEAFDDLPGDTFYRVVGDSEDGSVSSAQILDQVRYGDYTALSSDAKSGAGRALYFTSYYAEAYSYGNQGDSIMRTKVNSDAKFISIEDVGNAIENSPKWSAMEDDYWYDSRSLYALSHGYDGIIGSRRAGKDHERAIINRGVLTVSDTTKSIGGPMRRGGPTWEMLSKK